MNSKKIIEIENILIENYTKIQMPVLVYGNNVDLLNLMSERVANYIYKDNCADFLFSSCNKDLSIREIENFLNKTPMYDNTKLLVLQSAHKWTDKNFSSLLKILEDMLPFNRIIITSSSKMPPTIMSRCLSFYAYTPILKDSEIIKCILEKDFILLKQKLNESEEGIDVKLDSVFLWVKEYIYSKIKLFVGDQKSNSADYIYYLLNVWDNFEKTYKWYKKGVMSLKQATEIMLQTLKNCFQEK
ncbi:hypothetical protein [Candidatus Nesciobacter abundans]|uniref:DNA polymerase III delta N-terminal domain-containing protein n=1 Tax=Candidatus Nesciobacter abundans TaxID=2601668 RepID=A0A5C0UHH8_9PROT|nr:hypothetical protein [Candidatus Nesciobacter abundans]QEK39219.1 hypothetical protein FZC36_02170 [Candidatus Nesciobacter abundans]